MQPFICHSFIHIHSLILIHSFKHRCWLEQICSKPSVRTYCLQGLGPSLSCPPMNPQGLQLCLAHSRCSLNVCRLRQLLSGTVSQRVVPHMMVSTWSPWGALATQADSGAHHRPIRQPPGSLLPEPVSKMPTKFEFNPHKLAPFGT